MMLRIDEASICIAVVETPFATALITAIVVVVEAIREPRGLRLGLRELVLRRRAELVGGSRIREVWIDSWGTLVVNWLSSGGIAKEPGGVVRLLHGVCCGRGGRASCEDGYIYFGRHRPVT